MDCLKKAGLLFLQLQLYTGDTETQNKMKIQVAIARKILVAVWHMLSKEEDFVDLYLMRLERERKEEQRRQAMLNTLPPN